MAGYKGDSIVRWAFYETNKSVPIEALAITAKCFENVFMPKALAFHDNDKWFEINMIDDLIKRKTEIESNYSKWPHLILLGHPKIKTTNGSKVIDYPKITKFQKNPRGYVFGIEFKSKLMPGSNQAGVLIEIMSDDWFLSDTDLSTLELFNKSLAEAKEKLQPEDFHVDGPADSATEKFSGLFGKNGFDIEKINKMHRLPRYKDE